MPDVIMPVLPQGASGYTETIKSAAEANGAIAASSSGRSTKSSSSSAPSRPSGALASIVKQSAVARSIGFAPRPPPAGPLRPVVSAHTSAKTSITVATVPYDLYNFTTVGNGSFVVSDGAITADIFVLGGGGGASYSGGGAGGLGIYSNVSMPPGTYVVRVGAGGAGSGNAGFPGINGGDSTVVVGTKTHRGIGGGGGSAYGGGDARGRDGGCGGGGMRVEGMQGLPLQVASDGGFNGFPGGWYIYGAGGGGMGGTGTTPNFRGGPGIQNDFTGVNVYYGGGGGGPDGDASSGGIGGGGRGNGNSAQSAGVDGLGGGAGGNTAGTGATGGSGRVMIRVKQ